MSYKNNEDNKRIEGITDLHDVCDSIKCMLCPFL